MIECDTPGLDHVLSLNMCVIMKVCQNVSFMQCKPDIQSILPCSDEAETEAPLHTASVRFMNTFFE